MAPTAPAKSGGAIDVAIIGGGIVGCATAYYLARRGAAVTVFERDRIGCEQSTRAWGFVRQQSRHPAEMPLAAEASRMWSALDRELQADLEFVRAGVLVPAGSESDEARLEEAASIARQFELEVRMLTTAEMRQILPDAIIRWRAGLLAPQDGHAEPAAATHAFAQAAMREGVTILERTPVLGVETTNGRVAGLVTPQGLVPCAAVLCAAGVGTASLARTLDISLPIQIVRASVAQTSRLRDRRGAMTAVWSPEVAFRPKRDGSYYVSNGYRAVDAEHDLTLDSFRHLARFAPTLWLNWRTIRLKLGREFLRDLARRRDPLTWFGAWPEPRPNLRLLARYEAAFHEVFPQFAGRAMARRWAGRIDATPDLIPIIDAVAEPQNLFVAAGFNGHGFALSPAVGKAMAELIWDGRSSQDLRAFRLARFKEGTARPKRNAL